MDSLQIEIFTAKECEAIRHKLEHLEDGQWVDGKQTAGSHAKDIKKNLQLKPSDPLTESIVAEVHSRLKKQMAIKSFCLPKKLHHTLISKTTRDGGYGQHVDNAFMTTGRADISYTVSLSNEKEYEGGELEILDTTETNTYKLKEGHVFIYPSCYLHSVRQVRAGTRYACVGWIESYMASHEMRMNLFNLESGARYLLAERGRSEALDRIFLAHANILRTLGG